ncbi:MAG: class I tRNA ligase family protein [Candidatus Levybacteria bacterium]|nr:class I tRNA ligase family protein [Candidatus Levybacteria bacterium]
MARAKEQNVSWHELADFWTKRFHDDMGKLNWIIPTNYLKASEQINSMINLIAQLLNNGLAYKVQGNIFLDITNFPQYGKLSHLSEKEMLKIAKEFDEDLDNPFKKHRLDITLWRASTPNQAKHIPSFDSPFGMGRPGWHIECSAMAISSLGQQIDIHGGGQDLKFPHHESEVIQSEGATGKIPFAKYWLHTGEVRYKGGKMSKSLGNLVLISDLLKKYSPNAIRWMLLSHHYRSSWEFTEGEMEKAQENVNFIEEYIKNFQEGNLKNKEDSLSQKEFEVYMNNDLDTPSVLSYILKSARNGLENSQRISSILQILGFRLPTS